MVHHFCMPPSTPPGSNGHGDLPPGLKTPAPHPAPPLAAHMAEAAAAAQEAAQAELHRRTAALHEQIAVMLATDPASLIMAIPDLFGASLVEMVAAGVQLGLQRAARAEQQAQQGEADAAVPRKPILLAQTGNVNMAARAAMEGMPPAGAP